jgi:phosphatidylinositol alpha-1,6-mannosyltransferase
VRHLLVTNDFPPKTGGIQSYLWELWRRLPPEEVTVLTTPHGRAAAFDAQQPFRIVRSREPVLLPNPVLTRKVNALAAEVDARAVVLDPGLPLGLIGPGLDLPYAVVLHGSEVTVPGRLPASRQLLARVLSRASLLIAAGGYPEAEARRAVGAGELPPVARIPPGVDVERFVPLQAIERAAARQRLDLDPASQLVVSVSRLVPRKGMDVLIDAAARLKVTHPRLRVAIGGTGRDERRLQRRVNRTGAPVRLLGWVADVDLPDLYAAADVFVLCCRTRWAGLEQEGFGIIFLEAAAAGVPSIAGDSGGAAEAVVDGVTGSVVRHPEDPAELAEALAALLDDPVEARRRGMAARARVEAEFGYDALAGRLGSALGGMVSGNRP